MSEAQKIKNWIGDNWSQDMTLSQWWDALFEAGYAFPSWPEGLGGFGATPSEARAIAAAMAEMRVIAPPAGNGPNMGAPTVLKYGTDAQKQRFVAPLAKGQTQWCQLFSEPGAGSDLASLAAKATQDGDEWMVSGQKVWNSKADVSEWGMLLCRTDLDAPKHKGITFMMVDMTHPGVEIRPLVQMNGATEFSEVFLTDVPASIDNVIGEVGAGWDVARTTLAFERAASGAAAGGGAIIVEAGGIPANLETPVGELVEAWTKAGGAPRRQPPLLSSREIVDIAKRCGLDDRPAVRDKVVRYHVHSEVYRRNRQRLRDSTRAKVKTALDGSMMKLDLAHLAHESRDLSLELYGAAGMLAGSSAPDGGRVNHTAMTAFLPSLGGGTNEIQKNIIAERTLGLPRDPAPDADVPFRQLRRS